MCKVNAILGLIIVNIIIIHCDFFILSLISLFRSHSCILTGIALWVLNLTRESFFFACLRFHNFIIILSSQISLMSLLYSRVDLFLNGDLNEKIILQYNTIKFDNALYCINYFVKIINIFFILNIDVCKYVYIIFVCIYLFVHNTR